MDTSTNHKDLYRRLQQHLDHMPVGFPATESGVEIELLKQLFDPVEARIALELSAFPEPAKKIFSRLGHEKISLKELEKILDDMVKKGAIIGYPDKNKRKVYHKIPLAIGMFEFQVDRVSPEFADLFFKYEDQGFARELFGNETGQMRTIPINVKINPEYIVGNYDDIRMIIKESPGPFALMNCVCRQAREKLSAPCRSTDKRKTCITLESAAKYMMERGVAEEIEKDDLLRLLVEFKKDGLILQPENTQHPTFICCCCGCCCGVLTAAKKLGSPSELIHTNFYAQLDPLPCDMCEKCLERCQMEAISRVNGHLEIDRKQCLGCGNCIPVCSKKALDLVKKDTEYIPPKNKNSMYGRMMKERFGLWGVIKFGLQGVLGRKV